MNSSSESKSFTSGYPLTTFSIRPFNDYDLTGNPTEAAQRKAWNRQLSSVQIFVEHAFGRLKGRFPYLRFMPGRNMTEMYRIIEALMIVHNILEEYGASSSSPSPPPVCPSISCTALYFGHACVVQYARICDGVILPAGNVIFWEIYIQVRQAQCMQKERFILLPNKWIV